MARLGQVRKVRWCNKILVIFVWSVPKVATEWKLGDVTNNFKPNFMKKIGILLFSILFLSCSSDDSSGNSNQNGFTFNGTFYEVKTVYINDENTTDSNPSDIGFSLINKTSSEINSGNDLSNVATLYFDFNAVNVEQTTYTNILDYNGKINVNRTSGSISGGTEILSDNETTLQANNISVTINNITSTTVNFTFSFTRTDGQTVSGQYNGNYLTL